MLLGTLSASILGYALAGRELIRADQKPRLEQVKIFNGTLSFN